MNILFISNDPSIFIEGSSARKRMRMYADEVALQGGVLHILSRAPVTQDIHDGPLVLHGIRVGKIGALHVLPRIAHNLILEHSIAVVSAQDPFEYGWIAMKAIRGTNAKLHIQIHTDFLSPWFTRLGISLSLKVRMPLLNRFRQFIAGRVLSQASGIRVVSQRIRNSLITKYGDKAPQVSVIPIAVSTEIPDVVALPPHPFTFALIAVGRLESEKRIEDIIAAIHLLKESHPEVGAFIVGDGRERRRLERIARGLGLIEQIIFLGAREDARGLMRSAQAFIQTSAYEGYGLTFIEAALARVPIITSNVGIVGEVFEDGKQVLVAPVGSPTSFAACITRLVENQEACHQLVVAAEIRSQEHLATTESSPHTVIEDILRLSSSGKEG